MPTVAFSPLSELPEVVAAGPVGERFAQEMGCEGGAVTLAAAAAWLRALPYGSIDSESLAQDSLPVLAAKTGDCVDKHRAFLAFAHEAKQQFTWVKGFYKLTDKIVPGIADGLRAAGIGPPFLPATGDGGEAWVASFHCFVRMDRADAPPQFFDLTDGNCDGKAFRPTEYEVTIDSAPDMDPRFGEGKKKHEEIMEGWAARVGVEAEDWWAAVRVGRSCKSVQCKLQGTEWQHGGGAAQGGS